MLNPLPFANWNQPQRAGIRRRRDAAPEDPGFPMLLNPGEFMPAHYGIEEFEHDVHRVRNFISFVARKEKKMLSEGASIDYSAPGHQRILVNNDAAGLRNPDRLFQAQWANSCSSFSYKVQKPHKEILGLDRYWCPKCIQINLW